MSTTKTATLNDDAREFSAGESTGFGFRFGVKYWDRKASANAWTNYEGALFSSNENQINFLRSNLIKGAVITVTAKTEFVEEYEGKYKIKLNDCNLDFIFNPNSSSAPANNGPKDYTQAIADYNAQPPYLAQAYWDKLPQDVRNAIMG